MAETLNTLFAAYRESRDPALLARVFDRSAPRLLLIAVQLVGDRAEAEDLVQTTFVVVLEQVDSFDAGRDFLPWVTGILANRAKMALRRRRRQLILDRLPEPTAPEPVAEIETEEVVARVSRALDGLAQPYRHVLMLHLLHGLGGAQIARSLGRSPETVRTQLKRGLAMLRERLPVMLSLPVLAVLTEGRGLAAVRHAVLARAADAAPATAVSGLVALLGGMVMMKVGVGVMVLAAALCFFFVDFRDLTAKNTRSTAVEHKPETQATSSQSSVEPEVIANTAGASRQAIDTPDVDPDPVIITGRCVALDDGRALAGCRVSLSGKPSDEQRRDGARYWFWPDRAVTDHNGAFRFEVLPPEGRTLELWLDIDGFCGRDKAVGEARSGAEFELGDIGLERGTALRARVVDESGFPLAGVRLLMRSKAFSYGRDYVGGRGSTSAVDGSLFGNLDLAPGEHSLTATDGYQLLRPHKLIVIPGERELVVDIVVRARGVSQRVSGSIIDADGQPVAGARISYSSYSTIQNYLGGATVCSGKDGTFEVYRGERMGDSVVLNIESKGRRMVLRSAPIPWGTSDLRLELGPDCAIEIEVVEKPSGRPVEDFGIQLRWSKGRLVSGGIETDRGHHEGGRLRIDGLDLRGQLRLLVIPKDPELRISPTVVFNLDNPNLRPTRVAVERLRKVEVLVRSTKDAPVVGSTVEVIELRQGEQLDAATTTMHKSVVTANLIGTQRWGAALLLSSAVTDVAGRAVVQASSCEHLGIRVTGKTHAPAVVFPMQLEGKSPRVTVTVPESAILSGKVTPVGVVRHFSLQPGKDSRNRYVGFVLCRPDEARPSLPVGDPGMFEFAEDGSFSIGGIPPGKWELMLQWWQPTDPHSRRQKIFQPPLATLTLHAGETRSIELDLAGLAPAIVTGRILHDGKALCRARVTWVSRVLSASGQEVFSGPLGGIDTDDKGRFQIGGVLPGAMRLSARVVDPITGQAVGLDSGEWVTVRPASRIERDFDVAGHQVEVRILDRRGDPVGDRPLTLLHDEVRRAWSLRSNSDGRVTLRDAPVGRLRVILHAASCRFRANDEFKYAARRKGTALDPVEVPSAGLQIRRLR